MMTAIHNTQPRLTTLPRVRLAQGKFFGPMTIGPGAASIDAAYAAALRTHPVVQRKLAKGYLSFDKAAVVRAVDAPLPGSPDAIPLRSAPVGEAAVMVASDVTNSEAVLAQYTVEDARELIETEDDVSTLASWLETEKRKGVRSALEARIARVQASEAADE
jgi:hypothetical protein